MFTTLFVFDFSLYNLMLKNTALQANLSTVMVLSVILTRITNF